MLVGIRWRNRYPAPEPVSAERRAWLNSLPPGTVLVQAADGEARECTSLTEATDWLDLKDYQETQANPPAS